MKRLRLPLVVRIYGLGVLLAVIVVGSFVAVGEIMRRERDVRGQHAAAIVDTVTGTEPSLDALAREIAHVKAFHHIDVVVRDKNGVVVVGDSVPTSSNVITLPITRGPAAGGTAFVTMQRRPWPYRRHLGAVALIVLTLLAFGTVGVARWYGRPLATIRERTRAFGAGDLAARVRLARQDELGEVAHAFDEMAEKIERLLLSERELLANVSHELRTPLARIRAALDVATEGDPATAQAMLGEITQDLGELERLVDDVLTATRFDLEGNKSAASPPLRRGRVVVAELVNDASLRFRSLHRDGLLEAEIPPDLPDLDGDRMLLRRVLDNLIENARKYGKKGDPVRVRAAAANGAVEIEIEDHGIGIAAKDLENVFRPFFRADTSRSRSTGGLGLGLALARRIVEAHGGTIAIDSTVGEGTRARVALPIATA